MMRCINLKLKIIEIDQNRNCALMGDNTGTVEIVIPTEGLLRTLSIGNIVFIRNSFVEMTEEDYIRLKIND